MWFFVKYRCVVPPRSRRECGWTKSKRPSDFKACKLKVEKTKRSTGTMKSKVTGSETNMLNLTMRLTSHLDLASNQFDPREMFDEGRRRSYEVP